MRPLIVLLFVLIAAVVMIFALQDKPDSKPTGVAPELSGKAPPELNPSEVNFQPLELPPSEFKYFKFFPNGYEEYARVMSRPDKVPYNLKLRLALETHEGRDMWRFSMGLGWQPESKGWQAWQDMSEAEQIAKNRAEREQLLEDSDVRGL